MDKNNLKNKQSTNNEKSSFWKRDGFYVVLFLCLCVVAGVATYVNTSPKHGNSALTKQETNKVSLNDQKNKATNAAKVSDSAKTSEVAKTNVPKTNTAKDDSKKASMDNANLVKKDTVKNNTSVPTSAPAVTSMVTPVNGTIAQGYTGVDGTMAVGLDKVSRTILGEYIKVKNKGVPVYAAMNGTVSSVSGGNIVITSKDGKLKTTYDNLEPTSINIKVGDSVVQNSKIGVVGDSDNAKDRIVDCDHLYFQIDEKQTDGSYIDINPQNYIKY
ncbi:M23 family metallopeptidase [Clostridium sp.]|jgi:murein DD-endopeptidase MepM/ murein hydrolase activator NlpD|uniref:M23 family metallopeptidase n=1 Tax=Clostridium sp. TaxID=1506 RepID=UPI00258EB276|nr:M23 family metallopeptidase [Clostridium sp.]MDF2503787.1 peptidase family [Clostridium sp.]